MQSNKIQSFHSKTRSLDPHQWVIRYADYLYAFASSRMDDEDQARDLVQDTFLAALERVNNFEGRCSEKTWLTSILKNKVIDIYRKKSHGFAKAVDITMIDQTHLNFFDTSSGRWKTSHGFLHYANFESDPIIIKELAGALHRSIQKLPTLWRSVFSMKYLDDQTTKSICSELKVTPSNVWTIIHRSRNSLRTSLQKQDYQ